ncbi:MAG: hypothetical protein Ct9H300mP11_13120 [Chloroflexota bacterium]|nr:MAG: hypothetical protein Ct9H300mP11_13120 [Chloroflexota bacterium]
MLLERSQAQDPLFFASATLADVVYFTGGSPEHLLETVIGSAFFSALMEILDSGGVLAVPAPVPWPWVYDAPPRGK